MNLNTLAITILICLHTNLAEGGMNYGGGPSLLYVTTQDIRLVNSSRANTKPKSYVLVRNLTEGIALDFNYKANKICWTDHGLEMILCVTYNGTDIKNKTEVINTGLISPDGLACDWFTNKLYWTDGETNRIEVATMDGEHRKVLFWSDIDQPRAIALVPMRSIMFWTDWGEVPKIERAGMNGDPATRKVIVSEEIFWPNGLTVDYDAELVYWLDGKMKFIAVMNYDGKNRQKIVSKGLVYPFAITQFQNKLFWTDWQTWCIHVYEKNSTQNPRELINSEHVPMDIHVWEASRQPSGRNPCERDNGNCSHLCLLAPYKPGYTCACPIGIKQLDEHNCADGPQEILLLATRTDICLIYLDSLDYTHNTLPLAGIKYSIAVDYDPGSGFLYWTDDEVRAIKRARLNGSEQQDVIVDDVQHPDGLAVDWIARNLYWTDTGTDRIEVSRLDGSYRKVLFYEGLVEPRAIAVAPEHGWMFWSDWYEKAPKIERASLDGTERVVLVNSSLGWPNGITLDLERSKIYWCDAKTDKIEVANMDGSDRVELISDNLPHSFGLSLMGDYLYWTDWQRRAIDRVHKITGAGRETITDGMPNVMGVKAINLTKTYGTNPCAQNNGGCSHLCLNRPNNDYVCACQMTYELKTDQRTCVLPTSFLLFSRNETIGRISVENQNVMNNVILPLSGVKHASSLDFDIANNRIYWSDTKVKAIFRAFMNGSDVHRIVELGLKSPEGMAVDWVAQNIYWTDSVANKIEVARLDGTSRRALLWEGLDEPKSIAVNPFDGYIYWSEWGYSKSIKRAAMDGSHLNTLVYNTGHSKDLTVDYNDKELCWIELVGPTIQCYDLNRNTRKTIISSDLHKPMGLTIYKDTLFWADWSTGEVFAARKSSGYNRTVLHTNMTGITNMLILHSERQNHWNQCSFKNGGCSNLCLTLPAEYQGNTITYTCACPTHYILSNSTCSPPKSFMIYSQRNSVIRFLPDSSDCPEAVLPIQGLKGIKAIDFDPVSHYLYWIEGKTHAIKRALDNGSHSSVVVQGSSDHRGGPYDLAIDSLGRLLFWTCSIQDSINVTRLDNGSMVGVVMKKQGERPRLLAIHPTKRLLFWTDVGNISQLVRARLDGSHRIVIKSGQNVTALALDLETDMIVWAEGSKVFMCNIDGENLYPLRENKAMIHQLAIYGSSMYWLERGQQMWRFDFKSTFHDTIKLSHGTQLTDLVAVQQPARNHSCATLHKCSHICIGDETSLVCACPQGLALQDDKRACSTVPDCGRDHFTCGREHYTSAPTNKDCIPVSWRCDGQADCMDGSDELGCPACRPDQFRCQTGQCIEQAWVCDGNSQCPDGYDEAHCCKSKEEFKCPQTDVCVPISKVCDGMENCANGADESDAVCSAADRNLHAPPAKVNSSNLYFVVVLALVLFLVLFVVLFYYARKRCAGRPDALPADQAEDPLSPKPGLVQFKAKARGKAMPDVVHMSMLNGSQTLSYERRHITGASSSTNGSSMLSYPKETLNPPPSPVTTAASTRASGSTRYRHYRSIYQPPPPTPCSTDVCDESDCRYDAGLFPPPPTPRSHCHSESCPPSPSSRSSTYFSPLPPPPSPVPLPARGYNT